MLGVAGLGTAALAIQGYRIAQSGAGKFLHRQAANRPNYAKPGYRWGGGQLTKKTVKKRKKK